MSEQEHSAEATFAAKIDCRFPYMDRKQATALIAEGWSLSPDAAFGILHEICRKSRSETISNRRRHGLIDEWLVAGSHPLQNEIVPCARALVDGIDIAWPKALAVMEEVARYREQYAALNIAYFSGDCANEGDVQLEAAHSRIVAAWV